MELFASGGPMILEEAGHDVGIYSGLESQRSCSSLGSLSLTYEDGFCVFALVFTVEPVAEY